LSIINDLLTEERKLLDGLLEDLTVSLGAAPEPWLGGGQNIILQNLITKRKHKFKLSIFEIGKNINNMIYLI
jgi:hypothetical protein